MRVQKEQNRPNDVRGSYRAISEHMSRTSSASAREQRFDTLLRLLPEIERWFEVGRQPAITHGQMYLFFLFGRSCFYNRCKQ